MGGIDLVILTLFASVGLSACRVADQGLQSVDLDAGCIGSDSPSCVVYGSGKIEGSDDLWFQLQGTGPTGDADDAYCRGGYCAVAIFRTETGGDLNLVAHGESTQDAPWYYEPKVVRSPAGMLVVAESAGMGSGWYTDDLVFRQDGDGFRQIDVQSWKDQAAVPNANTHFDWTINYATLVGQISRMRADEWVRQPEGGCARADLALEGDALVVRAVRLSDTPASVDLNGYALL